MKHLTVTTFGVVHYNRGKFPPINLCKTFLLFMENYLKKTVAKLDIVFTSRILLCNSHSTIKLQPRQPPISVNDDILTHKQTDNTKKKQTFLMIFVAEISHL